MPKISVIIPAYRAQDTLTRSVNSVLKQAMQDFEIIIVDDGSPDKSGMIADELAMSDSRIKVIHEKNQGPLEARRSGQKIATGDYRMHLDSDDSLTPDALSTMYDFAQRQNLDFLLTGYKRITPRKVSVISPVNGEVVIDTRQMIEHLMNPNFLFIGCMCFSKSELWDSIEEIFPVFNKKLPGEDIIANFRLAIKSNRIGIVEKPVYNYYYNPNSLTSLRTYFEQDMIHNFFNEIEDILKQGGFLDEMQDQLNIMKLHYVGFYVPHIDKTDPWIKHLRNIPKNQLSKKYKVLQFLLCNNTLRRLLISGHRCLKSAFRQN